MTVIAIGPSSASLIPPHVHAHVEKLRAGSHHVFEGLCADLDVDAAKEK